MNKQFKIVDGKRVATGIEWTDYTWNPIAGCLRGCRWTMPDGKVAVCYAEAVAGGLAQKAYPNGFEHHYCHSERLSEPAGLKAPAKIFAVSMGDLFGHWVPELHVKGVLCAAQKNAHHTFQLLTKSPARARVGKFTLPTNVWLGASSPPDYMHSKALNDEKKRMLLGGFLQNLRDIKIAQPHVTTWMSFEPLSWDVASVVAEYPGAIQWAVIGAASAGRTYYPPEEAHLRALQDALDDQGVPTFYKGNLRSLAWAEAHWREDYPNGSEVQQRCPKKSKP